MSDATDLTRWNRAGLGRFRYINGNAITYLEQIRDALARDFDQWSALQLLVKDRNEEEYLERIGEQYRKEATEDYAWEIARGLARACHILTEHIDTYANEGFLGTATQWDNVRRLVEMLDYHPAPPASASTSLILEAKEGKQGTVERGLQFKYKPPQGGAPVVFETLEDVEVDAALNRLYPAEYNRSQDVLTGNTLYLEGEVSDLTTGEPIVLENEQTGEIKAYLIQGVSEGREYTQVTVSPRVPKGYKKGYTRVHVVPKDRLSPVGPVASGADIDRLVRLKERPEGLLAGEIIWISDGVNGYFRRVVDVRGLALILDRGLGTLAVEQAAVHRPVEVGVSRLGGRPVVENNQSVLVMMLAGDWTRLTGKQIGDYCRDPATGQSFVVAHEVMAATYTPVERTDDARAGYTELRVSVSGDVDGCELYNPQAILVQPVGGGLWDLDTYIEKQDGHLPVTITTAKPKKTSAGDLAVVVRGNQAAWTRLLGVSVDLKTERAELTAEGVWQDRGGGDWFLADTTVYAHFDQSDLRLYGWQDNTVALTGNEIPLDEVPSALNRGRKLIVECSDDASKNITTTVAKIETDNKVLVLKDALPDGYTYGSLSIAGNVVSAGHGEAKPEKVLGSGKATASNQSFVLAVSGAAFVADATMSSGVRADIEVKVAGRAWEQVSTLKDSQAEDHHYTVHMTEDGYLKINFGDGANGRRLPTGTNNLRIAYRTGSGLRGNIPAGSLTKPAKPHRLVEKLSQPAAATGGNDMEDVELLRENAPPTVLTIERAVSLEDFGNLATGQSSVWQARAFRRPAGLNRKIQIEVVVVPAGGGELGDLEGSLRDYLRAHAIPNVEITVLPYQEQYFSVDVTISVDSSAYDPDEVVGDVEQALEEAFGLKGRGLGQDVYLSEIYQYVEGVTGVEHSTVVLNGSGAISRVEAGEPEVLLLGDYVVRHDGAQVSDTDSAGTSVTTTVTKPVENRGTQTIQSVGRHYRQALAALGVTSIADLRDIDPDEVQGGVPSLKLWEFKVKANLVGAMEVDSGLPSGLLSRTLLQVVESSTDSLVALSGRRATEMESLKSQLRRIQIALDETEFAAIRLRDFIAN